MIIPTAFEGQLDASSYHLTLGHLHFAFAYPAKTLCMQNIATHSLTTWACYHAQPIKLQSSCHTSMTMYILQIVLRSFWPVIRGKKFLLVCNLKFNVMLLY